MVTGRIVKGIAGFYYVYTGDYGIVECHAKGAFRKDKVKPLVGDRVQISLLEENTGSTVQKHIAGEAGEDFIKGSIDAILPRKSQLIRPAVANVDQAMVVFAHTEPEPNLNLLDKFLIMMNRCGVSCIIGFNKQDKVSEDAIRKMVDIYKDSGVPVFSFSAKLLDGNPDGNSADRESEAILEKIKELLSGKETVLAGPSGVGKSTLINRIYPRAYMETGEISKKSERGKHTTRHSELFCIGEESFLMDTPGFTAFSLVEDMEKEEIKDYYPEFYPYEGKCRYDSCSHTHEPDCAVKVAVEQGKIHPRRYQGYVSIYEEMAARRRY